MMFRSLLRAVTLLCLALTPAFAVDLQKPAERKPAPSFELTNAAGQPVKLSSFKGKIVLIDFWATWCIPCRAGMPWLNELAAKYKRQGVEVLGISMDEEGWKVVKPFLDEIGVKYPVVIGNDKVGEAYGDVDSLPAAFFIDRNQKIAGTHVGEATRDDFESTIQALLKAK